MSIGEHHQAEVHSEVGGAHLVLEVLGEAELESRPFGNRDATADVVEPVQTRVTVDVSDEAAGGVGLRDQVKEPEHPPFGAVGAAKGLGAGAWTANLAASLCQGGV